MTHLEVPWSAVMYFAVLAGAGAYLGWNFARLVCTLVARAIEALSS